MIESTDQIDMVRESRLRPLDPRKAAGTNAGSIEAFERLLRESQEDPASFWEQVASELDWIKPWDSVRKGGFENLQYFSGGISNVCLNLLDRLVIELLQDRILDLVKPIFEIADPQLMNIQVRVVVERNFGNA